MNPNHDISDYLISYSFDTLPLGLFKFYSVSIKILPIKKDDGDGFGDDDMDKQMGDDWVRIKKEHSISGSDLETTHVFFPKIYVLLSKNYKITVNPEQEDIDKGVLSMENLVKAFTGNIKDATRTSIFADPAEVVSQIFKLLGQHDIKMYFSNDSNILSKKGLSFSIQAISDVNLRHMDFNFFQYVDRLYSGLGLIISQELPKINKDLTLKKEKISLNIFYFSNLENLECVENEGYIAMSETINYNRIAKYSSIQIGSHGNLAPVNALTPGVNYDKMEANKKMEKITSEIAQKSVAPTTGEVLTITSELFDYFYKLDVQCTDNYNTANYFSNKKKTTGKKAYIPYKTKVVTNKPASDPEPPKKGKNTDLTKMIQKDYKMFPANTQTMNVNVKKWNQGSYSRDTDTTIPIKSDAFYNIPEKDKPKPVKILKTGKVEQEKITQVQSPLPMTNDIPNAKMCAETFIYTIMRNAALTKNLIEVYSTSGNFFGVLPHYSITKIEKDNKIKLPVQKFDIETFNYKSVGELQIPTGTYLILGTHIRTKMSTDKIIEYESSVTLINLAYILDFLSSAPKCAETKVPHPIDLSGFLNQDGVPNPNKELYIDKLWGGKDGTPLKKIKKVIKKIDKLPSKKNSPDKNKLKKQVQAVYESPMTGIKPLILIPSLEDSIAKSIRNPLGSLTSDFGIGLPDPDLKAPIDIGDKNNNKNKDKK